MQVHTKATCLGIARVNGAGHVARCKMNRTVFSEERVDHFWKRRIPPIGRPQWRFVHLSLAHPVSGLLCHSINKDESKRKKLGSQTAGHLNVAALSWNLTTSYDLTDLHAAIHFVFPRDSAASPHFLISQFQVTRT